MQLLGSPDDVEPEDPVFVLSQASDNLGMLVLLQPFGASERLRLRLRVL